VHLPSPQRRTGYPRKKRSHPQKLSRLGHRSQAAAAPASTPGSACENHDLPGLPSQTSRAWRSTTRSRSVSRNQTRSSVRRSGTDRHCAERGARAHAQLTTRSERLFFRLVGYESVGLEFTMSNWICAALVVGGFASTACEQKECSFPPCPPPGNYDFNTCECLPGMPFPDDAGGGSGGSAGSAGGDGPNLVIEGGAGGAE
jgi:hypothetical protein